jgi:radical SAM superfamily enzyme YgiQ (UPF0313 family)
MVIYPKPNECKKPRFGFSYNWALISTILYSTGHNVIIHDYSYENFDDTIFSSQLEKEKIQVVIVEFDSFALKRSENYQHGDKLVQSIRNKYPEIMIIAYGYYCCITGENIPSADVTVKENNINHILSSIDQLKSKSASIEYKNFDTLPFINRSLIQTIPYFYEHNVSTLIQTAKGCENSCVFCQRKGWQSRYIPHSKEYILSEFDTLQSLNFKNIWITDENFTFHLERAKDILRGLIENNTTRNMKIAISSWANIDNEFLDLASQAYIKTISFGIETGNNEILQFYRKNIDLQKSKSLIKYANSIGIFTVGNFIIGAPMETIDTINETFDFIKECSFDQVNIKTLDYMIGSELYSSIDPISKGITHIFACKENGLNNFALEEINDIKRSFITQYYKDNHQFLRQKIKKYGTPFD